MNDFGGFMAEDRKLAVGRVKVMKAVIVTQSTSFSNSSDE